MTNLITKYFIFGLLISAISVIICQNFNTSSTQNSENTKTKARENKRVITEIKNTEIPNISDVNFSRNKMWVLPRTGEYLYFKNSKSTWNKLKTPKIRQNAKISFFENGEGWLANNNGEIFYSNSNGKNWKKVGYVSPKDFTVATKLDFTDANNGWLIDAFGIWKTDNGGKIWNKKKIRVNNSTRPFEYPDCSFFGNSRNTWIGESQLLQTKNGGTTWTASQDKINCDSIFFLDSNIGWMSSGVNIFGTTNSGRNWDKLTTLDKEHLFVEDIHFLDKKHGWVISRKVENPDSAINGLLWSVAIHSTNDGGISWREKFRGEKQKNPLRIHFYNLTHGAFVIENKVYETYDSGNSWKITLNLGNQ